MKPRDPKKIYLTAVRDGDVFKLIDQDGREVWGLIGLDISAQYDAVTEFHARITDASQIADRPAHVNRNAG